MHSNSLKSGKVARGAVALLLSGALALGTTPLPAWADTDLEALQDAAIKAGDAYEVAQTKADALQTEIDSNEARIAEIESQLPSKRESASAAISSYYKMQQGKTSLLDLILSAETFNDFITQLTYLDAVASAHVGEITALNSLESELSASKAALETKKALADQEASEAQAAYNSAQEAKNAAIQKALEDAAAAKAAYEAQVAAGNVQDPSTQAVSASQDQATSQDSSGSSTNSTTQDSGSGSQDSPVTPAPATSYTYVLASMYGEGDGLMYSETATGERVTPTSMGVAMKTMPLGTRIEITYGGHTCQAIVNDRGPYVGNRQIDLQPAVAHALGFDGVGTVGYRVIS